MAPSASSPAASSSRTVQRHIERIAELENRLRRVIEQYEQCGEELLERLEQAEREAATQQATIERLEARAAKRAAELEAVSEVTHQQELRIAKLTEDAAKRHALLETQQNEIERLKQQLGLAQHAAERYQERAGGGRADAGFHGAAETQWGWATDFSASGAPTLVRQENSERRARQAVEVKPDERVLCRRKVVTGSWGLVRG